MNRGLINVALGIVALGVAGFLGAQSVPGLLPGSDKDAYGDWAVRCVERKGLVPCDIVQSVNDTKSKQTIMQVSYSYEPSKDQYAAQIRLPLGFLLPAGVLIRLDGKKDITNYQVTRCEAEGCFIEKLSKSAELGPFRNAEQGMVVVMGKDGKPVALPFSLKGFGDALDSMAGRNKRAAGK